MRFMTGTVDAVAANHFNNVAENVRVCNGDSGGPVFLNSNTTWIFGSHSTSIGDPCGNVGRTTRATRISQGKMDFINQKRADEGLSACTRHSAEFPDFWLCE